MSTDSLEQFKVQIHNLRSVIIKEQPSGQDQKSKQNLLKQEIYNEYQQHEDIIYLFCQFFVTYVFETKQIKIEDADPVFLTLEELKDMIKIFKGNLPALQAAKKRSEDRRDSKLRPNSVIMEDISHPKTFYKNKAWDYELVISDQPCTRQKHFFKYMKQPVSIQFTRSYFKNNKGFLGIGRSLLLWMQIETEFMGKKRTVVRDMEDFAFLQKKLHNIFPHSFIPFLNISKEDIGSNIDEVLGKQMISRCFDFLCKISKEENLLENIYTFKFLTEEKTNNYKEHQINNQSTVVNGFDTFKNIEGKVSFNVSQKIETIKEEIDKKSHKFQLVWKKIGEMMMVASQTSTKLAQNITNINGQLQIIKKYIQVPQISVPTYEQFSSFNRLVQIFQSILKIYQQTVKHSNQMILKLKTGFLDQVQVRWQEFNVYKAKINNNSQIYQQKRKQFLQRQLQKQMEQPNALPRNEGLGIKDLDLRYNVDEQEWFLKETSWYGYMNHQFTTTFKQFIKKDRQTLQRQILKVSKQIFNRQNQSQTSMSNLLGPMGDVE